MLVYGGSAWCECMVRGHGGGRREGTWKHYLHQSHRSLAHLRLAHEDDLLAHTHRCVELAHAILRLEVAIGAVDEQGARVRDIPLKVANLLEVVHVEEDMPKHGGHHLQQPLLDDAHLVLPRAPHVREEGVEVAVGLDRLDVDFLVRVLVAQPPRLLAPRLFAHLRALPRELPDEQDEGERERAEDRDDQDDPELDRRHLEVVALLGRDAGEVAVRYRGDSGESYETA